MNRVYILVLLLSVSLFAQKKDNGIHIGTQIEIKSTILNENRSINIYLPPSYGTNNSAKYPVIYLMDGDYNFHHVTGLVEQLSSIGEKIPEMIVVGISDKGHANYIKYCSPTEEADNFLKFINIELKPFIKKNYKVAELDILIGHSLGGLFTVNALLTNPESFGAYIAISPSLWWEDYKAEKLVESFFKEHSNLSNYFFLSIGNERGMGVFSFYDQFDRNTFANEYYKKEPLGVEFYFKHYKNENHNSVGIISVKDALEKMFNNYDLSHTAISNIKNFSEYERLMGNIISLVGSGFKFPGRQYSLVIKTLFTTSKENLISMESTIKKNYPASLGDYYNTLGDLLIKNDEIEKGIELLKLNCKTNPNSPVYLTSLADAYFNKGNKETAREHYKKALKLAIDIGSRNWYINQLKENVKK